MNTKTPDAQISDATDAAAQNDTRLICLLIDGAPDSLHCVSLYGISGIPDYWAEMVPKVKEAQEARVQKIEALLAKSNASGIVQSAICAAIEVKHVAPRVRATRPMSRPTCATRPTSCAKWSPVCCFIPLSDFK